MFLREEQLLPCENCSIYLEVLPGCQGTAALAVETLSTIEGFLMLESRGNHTV